MKKYSVAVRRYFKDGELSNVFIVSDKSLESCRTYVKVELEMEDLFGAPHGCLEFNPCNLSIRGPDGRFVKWKK